MGRWRSKHQAIHFYVAACSSVSCIAVIGLVKVMQRKSHLLLSSLRCAGWLHAVRIAVVRALFFPFEVPLRVVAFVRCCGWTSGLRWFCPIASAVQTAVLSLCPACSCPDFLALVQSGADLHCPFIPSSAYRWCDGQALSSWLRACAVSQCTDSGFEFVPGMQLTRL